MLCKAIKIELNAHMECKNPTFLPQNIKNQKECLLAYSNIQRSVLFTIKAILAEALVVKVPKLL